MDHIAPPQAKNEDECEQYDKENSKYILSDNRIIDAKETAPVETPNSCKQPHDSQERYGTRSGCDAKCKE